VKNKLSQLKIMNSWNHLLSIAIIICWSSLLTSVVEVEYREMAWQAQSIDYK